MRISVQPDGRMVPPTALRRGLGLGLGEGGHVIAEVEGDTVRSSTPRRDLLEARALFSRPGPEGGPPLVDEARRAGGERASAGSDGALDAEGRGAPTPRADRAPGPDALARDRHRRGARASGRRARGPRGAAAGATPALVERGRRSVHPLNAEAARARPGRPRPPGAGAPAEPVTVTADRARAEMAEALDGRVEPIR